MIREKPLAVRRASALFLSGVLVLLCWRIIVSPTIGEIADLSEQLANQGALLERYQQLVAEREDLMVRLTDAKRALPAGQALTGVSAVAGAAHLQQRVKQIFEKNGGRLQSTQVLQPVTEGPYMLVGLRVSAQLPPEALRSVLYALEVESPGMSIDKVELRGPSPGSNGPQWLEIRLGITGRVLGSRG